MRDKREARFDMCRKGYAVLGRKLEQGGRSPSSTGRRAKVARNLNFEYFEL
jgi:hypothetical protein